MNRRNFIKGSALTACGVSYSYASATDTNNSERVKFSVFADMHYRIGNYNWTVERLGEILARAKKNNVDFVIQCGDFCHNVKKAAPVLDPYNKFEIPTYHVMGNHDFEATKTLEEVCEAYKLNGKNFYFFDRGVFRFIVLDTNYFHRKDGTIMHYASSSAYEKCHQKEAIVTPEQIEMLKDGLLTAKGPCVVFSHHGFKYTSGISNASEIKKILFEYQRTPVMWINGHHHRNSLKLENQIAFFNLNSTTSEWVGVPHKAYPANIMDKCSVSQHELLYAKPVHAIVTITRDGEFNIEGMTGGMFMGITPEMTGNKSFDSEGLPCDGNVLSSHFKLYNPKQ